MRAFLSLLLITALPAAVAAPVAGEAEAVAPPATASLASPPAATAMPGDAPAENAARDASAAGASEDSAPGQPSRSQLRRERAEAYEGFRREFAAGRFVEALPLAERVVELSEALEQRDDLPSAYNNLGATHLQLGDRIAAEKAYVEAIRLIEMRAGAASPRLVSPLRGLALTYAGGGRKDAAIPLLERAVAISRRTDGLFNPGQMELVEPLIDHYVAERRWQDAEQAHQYAYRVAERQYGASARLAPALSRLARWYEETSRFTQARRTWARQYQLSTRRADGSLGDAVNALRGMARTYRLEYQYGPEVIETEQMRSADLAFRLDAAERDPFGRRIQSLSTSEYRLDPQGREFLEAALEMVEQADPPAPLAVATLLVELGDWTALADRKPDAAFELYARAWPLLPQDPGTAEALGNPLLYPGQLLYRAPTATRRHGSVPPAALVQRYAVAEFTVTPEGRLENIEVVEGDADQSHRDALVAALERAVYRPRFVDGRPVATERVRLRETFPELRTEEDGLPPSMEPGGGATAVSGTAAAPGADRAEPTATLPPADPAADRS